MDQHQDLSEVATQTGEQHIIGIAASAGGLEAISQLLNSLPRDTGASFVIAQHMSPNHKSLMLTLLARETDLPVVEIGDDVVPQPNTIYLTPPNTDVLLNGDRLCLAKPPGSTGAPKPSADRLFNSIAAHARERAIGIVLSGTGSDGSYGVQAIREAGGITIAQDVASAKYDGMPLSAAGTGCVDLVLSPMQIGQHIGKILADPRNFEGLARLNESPSKISDLLQILLARTRVDFREYKESTVQRRIQRRMVALGIDDYEDYVRHCRASTHEVDALFKDLLISVTRFFRDPEEFGNLASVIESLAANPKRPIRIWVAGCATGEEAYSVAILVAEALGGLDQLSKDRVQIFATDIDRSAIERARAGEYPSSALEDVPSEFRAKYFRMREGRVSVRPELRSVILFSLHNVIQDPPFINVDLVTLRNLLIYFSARLQEKVLSRVFHALSSHGYLFLGRSETIGTLEVDFESAHPAGRVFRRRSVARKGSDLPFADPIASSAGLAHQRRTDAAPQITNIDRAMFDTLARSLGSHAVLVTAKQDIVRVYGDISPFVELSEKSNLNLRLSLLRKPLRDEARSLCVISLKRGERKRGMKQPMAGEGYTHVQIETVPIQPRESAEDYVLVVFNTFFEPPSGAAFETAETNDAQAEQVRQLQTEVETAREALQQTIEELQTSNEELQSVNEELQSTNEELQASNEELETSNEELQSTNEELITVNEELQVNSAELDATRSELEAVIDASPMPILVINSALQINRASRPAQDLFRLPENYMDRHLSECEVPEGFPNLIEVASRVFADGTSYESTFRNARGLSSMICGPYSTPNGQLRGVNLVVSEVESAGMIEVRSALTRLEMVQDLSDLAHYELDLRTNHLSWSGKVFDIHGLDRGSGQPTLEEAIRFYHEDDRQRVADYVSSALTDGEDFRFSLRLCRADGEIVKVESQGRVIPDDGGSPAFLVGVFRQLPRSAEIGS